MQSMNIKIGKILEKLELIFVRVYQKLGLVPVSHLLGENELSLEIIRSLR